MCTICRNEIFAVLKRESRTPTLLVDDDVSVRAALESLIDPGNSPDSLVGTSELARLIKVTLDSLPIDYADRVGMEVR